MRNLSLRHIAIAGIVALTALGSDANAQSKLDVDTYIAPGMAKWVQGAGNSLFTDPPETLVGIGTDQPKATLHVDTQNDASLHANYGALRISRDTANGQQFLLIDSNEIMTGAFVSQTSVPYVALSPLYLQDEGGAVVIHGSLPTSNEVMVYEDGRVRIGSTNSTYSAQAKLSVDGLLVAEEIRVTPDGWADDVFSPGYAMLSDAELGAYVREHRHLPGIPSEESVLEDGLPVASFSTNLLRNVEELTLRVVAQSKELDSERRAHARELQDLREKYDERLAKLEQKLDRALGKR